MYEYVELLVRTTMISFRIKIKIHDFRDSDN